jgi:hypothetical protein
MLSPQPSPRLLRHLCSLPSALCPSGPPLPVPTDSQSLCSFRTNPPPPPLRVSQSQRFFFPDFVISLRIRTLPFLATSPLPSIFLDFVDLTESRRSAARPPAPVLITNPDPFIPAALYSCISHFNIHLLRRHPWELLCIAASPRGRCSIRPTSHISISVRPLYAPRRRL